MNLSQNTSIHVVSCAPKLVNDYVYKTNGARGRKSAINAFTFYSHPCTLLFMYNSIYV